MIDNRTQPGDVVAGEAGEVPRTSDEVLASRGDTDSFIALYRAYLRPVYRYIYARLGGNWQEAEDLTSLVFERAWVSLANYRPVGTFRGWLFTIAARTLADHFRSSRSRQGQTETLDVSMSDTAIGPEESLLLTEDVRSVLRAISSLGAEQREIVTLRFVAGLRYSEIAAVLNKREPAIKMAAYRAIEEIRRRYTNGEF